MANDHFKHFAAGKRLEWLGERRSYDRPAHCQFRNSDGVIP